MAPNRVVALTAPLAAPLAGAFAAWLSQEFPGVSVPREAVEEVFLAVSALVFGLAFQFNHNRYKWDELMERQASREAAVPDPLLEADADVADDEFADEEEPADEDALADEEEGDEDLGPDEEFDGAVADADADGALSETAPRTF